MTTSDGICYWIDNSGMRVVAKRVIVLDWLENGYNMGVKLLVEQEDFNLDRLENDGQTLLLWATRNVRVGVVELLLEQKEVGPDMPDNDYRTVH